MTATKEQASDRDRAHAKAAAWLVLIAMGGTSVIFNIYHAIHAGHMNVGLALLYGLAPVMASMGLSHIVASHKGGWVMQTVTFLVMIGAMALSIGATGSVVQATSPAHMEYLFGLVLDAAALVALAVILSPARQMAPPVAHATAPEMAPGMVPHDGPETAPPTAPEAAPPTAPQPAQATALPVAPRQRTTPLAKDPDAEKARTEYRKSVRAGAPLSDRALGTMFGRSRNWGAARIREVGQGPQPVNQAAAGQ